MSRPCECGSKLPSYWAHDGRGIPLARVCAACKSVKLSQYRKEILDYYTQSDVDEPIDEED